MSVADPDIDLMTTFHAAELERDTARIHRYLAEGCDWGPAFHAKWAAHHAMRLHPGRFAPLDESGLAVTTDSLTAVMRLAATIPSFEEKAVALARDACRWAKLARPQVAA